MIQARRQGRCQLCNHIAVDKVNFLLMDPAAKLSPGELRTWLQKEHPTEPIPTVHSIINHRDKHIKPNKEDVDLGALSIDRKTGNLVNHQGKTVEAVGILAALKTMVTIGIQNILNNPGSVSPQATLEALKMIRAMGVKDDDPDEDAWGAAVIQPTTKQTPKQQLDNVTKVIEVEYEEDGVT